MPSAKEDEESFSGLHEQRGDPMRRWNRTTITWISERATNIPISDWWNKNPKQKPCHELSRIAITSQPNGTGHGEITINGKSKSGLCAKDHLIVEKRLADFRAQNATLINWQIGFGNHISGFGEFTFALRNNEHFTDRAIDIARQIYEALGASEGFSSIPFLACFYITQKTLVFHCGRWIGFGDYLRAKHNLPNLSETGWGDTNS